MLDLHVRWEVLDLKRVRSPISLSLAPLVCHSCSLPRCLVRLFLALAQQPTGASCYITSTNIGLYTLPSFFISVLLPLTGASFYSSPAQIAKRDELEAKQKAAKLADDEAALKAKKDKITAGRRASQMRRVSMTPVVSAPQAMKKGRRKSSSVKIKKKKGRRPSIAKMKSNGKQDVSLDPPDGLGDIAEGKVQHATSTREDGKDGEDDEKERVRKSKSAKRGQLLAIMATLRNAASMAYAALKDAEVRMLAAPAGSPERAMLEKEVAEKKAALRAVQEEVEAAEAAVAKAEEELDEDAGEGGESPSELSAGPPAAAHGETNERGGADGGCGGGSGDGEGGGSGGGGGDTVGELAPPLALTVSSICEDGTIDTTRDGGDKSEVLSSTTPAEGAVALSAMTSEERAVALESAPPATRAAVLAAMSPDDRAAAMAIIASFPTGNLLKKQAMRPKERAAVLWALGQEERVAALAAMSKQERAAALAFASPQDRAAALAAMNADDRAEAMKIITSFSTHGRRTSIKVRSSFSVGRDPKMIMKTLSSPKKGSSENKHKLESVPSALCVLVRSDSTRSPKQQDTNRDEVNHVDE